MNEGYLKRSADLSECGRYRYRLERWWRDGEPAVFVMLNPSTANATEDDPTIRRCMAFSRSWGYSGIIVVNLFSWRATRPSELPAYKHLAVGPHGDAAIRAAVIRSSMVVCAWGAHGSKYGRGAEVLDMIREYRTPRAIRITKDGYPAHPLYLPGHLQPQPIG